MPLEACGTPTKADFAARFLTDFMSVASPAAGSAMQLCDAIR
jgi:hypothetical protein